MNKSDDVYIHEDETRLFSTHYSGGFKTVGSRQGVGTHYAKILYNT